MRVRLVLMPGMDGTGALLAPLAASLSAAMPDTEISIVSYPTDEVLGYAELADWLCERETLDADTILVAESFSGPLAVEMAERRTVGGVVLASTFVQPPLPAASLLRAGVTRLMFAVSLPGVAVRALLVGWRAPAALVCGVQDAVAQVAPAVLAHRLREILAVDVSSALARCAVPAMYISARRDVLLGGRALRVVQRLRPSLPVSVLDAPHLVLQTNPDTCAAIIVRFVRERAAEGVS